MTRTDHGPRSDGTCDDCGHHGPRHLIVIGDHATLPRHALLCPHCTGDQPMPRQPTASEVLTLAADKLEQHGLAQGVTIDRQERLCAEEAICRATHQLGGTVELAGEATALVIEHIRRSTGENFTRLRRWNDYPTRTRADVVQALRAAAATPVTALPAPAEDDRPVDVPKTLEALERAVFTVAEQLERYGNNMDRLLSSMTMELAGTFKEVRTEIAAVDTKLDELRSSTVAAFTSHEERLDAIESLMGRLTAEGAERYLRDVS